MLHFYYMYRKFYNVCARSLFAETIPHDIIVACAPRLITAHMLAGLYCHAPHHRDIHTQGVADTPQRYSHTGCSRHIVQPLERCGTPMGSCTKCPDYQRGPQFRVQLGYRESVHVQLGYRESVHVHVILCLHVKEEKGVTTLRYRVDPESNIIGTYRL